MHWICFNGPQISTTHAFGCLLKFGSHQLLSSLTHMYSGAIRTTRQPTNTFSNYYSLQTSAKTIVGVLLPFQGEASYTPTSAHMFVRSSVHFRKVITDGGLCPRTLETCRLVQEYFFGYPRTLSDVDFNGQVFLNCCLRPRVFRIGISQFFVGQFGTSGCHYDRFESMWCMMSRHADVGQKNHTEVKNRG